MNPIQTYLCPLYKTTHRLSKGIVSSDKTAQEYIPLESMIESSRWTKRSVALLLEIEKE